MTTLFLDFDGVLHPEFCHPNQHFSCLPHLEAAVRRVPDCEIVIASTWRLNHPLQDMLRSFSPDIAARVVGVTPFVIHLTDIPDSLLAYEREAECQAWLRSNDRAHLPWLALDDRSWIYRPFNRHLYLVDGRKGLQASDVDPLVQRLQQAH